MRPTDSIARETGASLSKDKCVRVSDPCRFAEFECHATHVVDGAMRTSRIVIAPTTGTSLSQGDCAVMNGVNAFNARRFARDGDWFACGTQGRFWRQRGRGRAAEGGG